MPNPTYTEEDMRLADRIRKCEREHGAKVALAALISKVRLEERERAVRVGFEAGVELAVNTMRQEMEDKITGLAGAAAEREAQERVLRELEGEGEN